VLLDSVQSQANRIELAILDAYRRKKIKYPDITLVENPVPGGGGTEHRVVLRPALPPASHQTRSRHLEELS
jgi:hypothetical protein